MTQTPSPRPISLRAGLVLALASIVVVLGGAVQLTTLVGTQRAVRTLSQNLVANAATGAEVELIALLGPFLQQLELTAALAETGLLAPTQTEDARRLLSTLMLRNDVLLAAKVADEEGNEVIVTRTETGLGLRQTRPQLWGDESRWTTWNPEANAEGSTQIGSELLPEPREYDVTSQNWFEGALDLLEAGGGVFATNPYFVVGSDKLGVTNSIAVQSETSGRIVVAFNILIEEIQEFVEGLEVSERGTALILSETRQLIAIPPKGLPAGMSTGDWLFRLPEEIDSPLLRAASAAYVSDPGDLGRPRNFRSGGEMWWADVRPVAVPGGTLIVVVLLPEADLLANLTRIRRRMLLVTFGGLALALLCALALANRFSGPIEALVRNSKRIQTGDFQPGEPVPRAFAEIETLARAQERMREGLNSLGKLRQDLELARQIQRSTMPSSLPSLAGWDFAASSQPAEETGGDIYDAFGLDSQWALPSEGSPGERAVFLLGDATGHGIGPALSVAQLRGMLRGAIHSEAGLAAVMSQLNEQLVVDLPANRFITAWIGAVTESSNTLSYVSAGQGPLLHLQRDRGQVERLNASSPPLGMVAGLPISTPPSIELASGDLFVVLSDGYFEAESPAGEEFGSTRVVDLLVALGDQPTQEILNTLNDSVDTFTEGARPNDDRTAIVLRRLPT